MPAEGSAQCLQGERNLIIIEGLEDSIIVINMYTRREELNRADYYGWFSLTVVLWFIDTVRRSTVSGVGVGG